MVQEERGYPQRATQEELRAERVAELEWRLRDALEENAELRTEICPCTRCQQVSMKESNVVRGPKSAAPGLTAAPGIMGMPSVPAEAVGTSEVAVPEAARPGARPKRRGIRAQQLANQELLVRRFTARDVREIAEVVKRRLKEGDVQMLRLLAPYLLGEHGAEPGAGATLVGVAIYLPERRPPG
ncbi:MAG: hypothetical protein QOF51_2372 [Chloroflexota bacterium]|nr:hypothetical protein [Chloroflexota bacterium]